MGPSAKTSSFFSSLPTLLIPHFSSYTHLLVSLLVKFDPSDFILPVFLPSCDAPIDVRSNMQRKVHEMMRSRYLCDEIPKSGVDKFWQIWLLKIWVTDAGQVTGHPSSILEVLNANLWGFPSDLA